jgi:hypothetical protein
MEQLAAVIVENRKFDTFGEVCNNHLKFLPKGTKLFVLTDETLVEEYTKQLNSFGIKNVEFGIYDTERKIPHHFNLVGGFSDAIKNNNHMKSILNYCLLMTSSDFWKWFNGFNRVLTFQMDTAILRTGIEQFYGWDYIGAPCYSYINEHTIMNGGLSLRNPRMMEYICRYHGWDTDFDDLLNLGQASTASFFAEDIFFSLRMIKYGIGNYAPLEQAKLFSVESKFNWGSLGYHNPDRYLNDEDLDKLKTQYLKKDLEIKK